MIVPQYWAEARIKKRINGRIVTVKRFGWSDISKIDAEQNAENRTNKAIELIKSGQQINNFEPKIPYNGADGIPIREEIVASYKDSVITRNSFGALCINTPDVLFADVDFESKPSFSVDLFPLPLLMIIGVTAMLSLNSWAIWFGIILFTTIVANLIFKLFVVTTGGAEKRAKKRIRKFVANNPKWHLRVYRTPAGYRILVMHKTFNPNAEETLDFFDKLKSDPIYVQMCKNQRCFRARLSPKPWRIGIEARMKPRPGIWPINPERMPDRMRWIDNYEKISRKYASCRFEEQLGSKLIDPKAEYVRTIHDKYCKANTNLTIA